MHCRCVGDRSVAFPCSLPLLQERSPASTGEMPSCAHPEDIALSFWLLSKVEEAGALSLRESSAKQQMSQRVSLKWVSLKGLLSPQSSHRVGQTILLILFNDLIPKAKFDGFQLRQYLGLVLAQGGVAYTSLLPPSTQTRPSFEVEN